VKKKKKIIIIIIIIIIIVIIIIIIRGGGIIDFVLERTCPEKHPKYELKSGFVSDPSYSVCKPKNIAIRFLK